MVAVCTYFAMVCALQAQPLKIVVGDHILEANQAGQIIEIHVTGNIPVSGVNLNIQIDEGGSAMPGQSDRGPRIEEVDVTNDTIFDGNHADEFNPGSFPQLAIRILTTQNGSVNAQGLLGKLTLDTTGVSPGTYALRLGDTLNGPRDFAGLGVDIVDGWVTVVPEPASLVLLGLLGCTMIRTRQRR